MTRHAVELAIIFEDALQENMATIEHLMVPNPICARQWEPLSHLRQRMLGNAFSFLPVWLEEETAWRLLADVELTRFLRGVTSKNERRRRLALTLERAAGNGVALRKGDCVTPDDAGAFCDGCRPYDD